MGIVLSGPKFYNVKYFYCEIDNNVCRLADDACLINNILVKRI